MPTQLRAARAGLLVVGGLSLVLGLDAALVRLQVPAPLGSDRLADVHGAVMVLGFLGTLIALERAVALRYVGHTPPRRCLAQEASRSRARLPCRWGSCCSSTAPLFLV